MVIIMMHGTLAKRSQTFIGERSNLYGVQWFSRNILEWVSSKQLLSIYSIVWDESKRSHSYLGVYEPNEPNEPIAASAAAEWNGYYLGLG